MNNIFIEGGRRTYIVTSNAVMVTLVSADGRNSNKRMLRQGDIVPENAVHHEVKRFLASGLVRELEEATA